MTLDRSIRKLARRLPAQPRPATPTSGLRLRSGVVTDASTASTGYVTVTVLGASLAALFYPTYTPHNGDLVHVLLSDGSPTILGSPAGLSST